MMDEIIFLTLAEAIEIHNNQINLYGGASGIRDISLLQSALAVSEATFDNKYLHKDLFEMAAAYAFHICQNHPFIDGNKRVALVAALVFLDFNGVEIADPEEKLYKAVMNLASGKMNKEILAALFRSLIRN
ncbi:MAG: type II toxin-antitoxin system death-on-curing family toxin [Spirochaetes bacterium]|nr:type II toxin-antitoxin system death-on-curing family toxin [Spirochaetota bacterium]MBN2770239.1 type II toxin-antitoxin system death-on-curing family toxin [Spirochaetota bacterium]